MLLIGASDEPECRPAPEIRSLLISFQSIQQYGVYVQVMPVSQCMSRVEQMVNQSFLCKDHDSSQEGSNDERDDGPLGCPIGSTFEGWGSGGLRTTDTIPSRVIGGSTIPCVIRLAGVCWVRVDTCAWRA